jgi:hypothetical protein
MARVLGNTLRQGNSHGFQELPPHPAQPELYVFSLGFGGAVAEQGAAGLGDEYTTETRLQPPHTAGDLSVEAELTATHLHRTQVANGRER